MSIFIWLILICSICFVITRIILSNSKLKKKINWIKEKKAFIQHMEWLGVDRIHAKEALYKIKTYEELLKANRELKYLKNGTTPNRKRRTEKR
jgi:hypothetical protein